MRLMIVRTIIKGIVAFSLVLFLRPTGYGQTQTLSASYRISHTTNTRFIQSCNFIHTRDNATIMVGKWGSSEDASDLLIMKLNERGEVLWSKKIGVGRMLREYELTEMSDGSIVFAGNSFYNSAPVNSDIVVIKFTCKGEIVWSKNLSMNASVSKRYMTIYSIKEGKNNDAIISFYGNETNWQYAVICRVNASGDLVWSKTFYGIDAQTNLQPISFFADDKIVVFGLKSLYSNSYIYNKSLFAMKLNYDNGAVEVTKGYEYSEFITNSTVLVTHPKIHFYAEQLSGGNFALFGVFSNSDGKTASFYKILLDKNLTIYKTNTFSVPVKFAFQRSKIRVFPNGQTHILSTDDNYNMIYWYAIDSMHNKIREKRFLIHHM